MSAALLGAYRDALEAGHGVLHEDAHDFSRMPELEWQARWFAGELGNEWTTVAGEHVRIEDFGRWNREPGPDFVEARVQIAGRTMRGAIELDRDARDWERHGHATNPAFREVVLHIFLEAPARRFFTRTNEHREVAQLQLPARHAATHRVSADTTPLLPGGETGIILAAARHRMDQKARALHSHAAVHGEDHAWFAALATALGYRKNQTPFLLLAQRAGLAAAANPGGEALLFGLAGFLESPAPPETDPAVRIYLRELWETWWKLRAGCERLILPPQAWHFAGTRPANHPHRRVAALARIAAHWSAIRHALSRTRKEELKSTLDTLAHPFWSMRYNLRAEALDAPQALIGPDRIRDIAINILHPLAIARDEAAWTDFLRERGPSIPSSIRKTALRFLGNTELPLSSAAIQQGLLQLERDYRAAPDPARFLETLRMRVPPSTNREHTC